MASLTARIMRLEERRRPVADRISKEARDAAVAASIARLRASPDAMAAVRARLRGNQDAYRSGLAAIEAALSADT
jgi:hypothetical protein